MKELKIQAVTDNLSEVLSFVDEQLEAADCPIKTQLQIDVAVEEIFVNIAHYAYASGSGPAELCAGVNGDPPTFEMIFIDSGIPFDPLAKPDPDITLPAEKKQIGGLGIYIVKKTMDEVSYEYRDGHNYLTLKKVHA